MTAVRMVHRPYAIGQGHYSKLPIDGVYVLLDCLCRVTIVYIILVYSSLCAYRMAALLIFSVVLPGSYIERCWKSYVSRLLL